MSYIIREFGEVTCREPFCCFKCGKEVKKGIVYMKHSEGFPNGSFAKLCKKCYAKELKKAKRQLK